ncbi:HIT family protein [Niveibacterium sp. SC-1]|uniref:HIT family protein n=1 Tax=Niveibacterium sp. SC-1 TaxID=3135646 RepID=UPI00311E0E3C
MSDHLSTPTNDTCELCAKPGGELLWEDARCRIVQVDDAAFPGFCRVIWKAHVAEMTDLTPADRAHLMQCVWTVEATLRALLQPTKINLASLGNLVPHLHWHVIPRFADDSHFPSPIWAAASRAVPARAAPSSAALREALQRALARAET